VQQRLARKAQEFQAILDVGTMCVGPFKQGSAGALVGRFKRGAGCVLVDTEQGERSCLAIFLI